MSPPAREQGEEEIFRQIGSLLTQAKQLTDTVPETPGRRFLDYVISIALLEVASPTKE